jgi:hypothetical protein
MNQHGNCEDYDPSVCGIDSDNPMPNCLWDSEKMHICKRHNEKEEERKHTCLKKASDKMDLLNQTDIKDRDSKLAKAHEYIAKV